MDTRIRVGDDTLKGCMYGLAIGDALGAPVEFKFPGEFAPVTIYRSGGPHSLNAGEWTDDTSMALALADSLARGWDTKDQLTRYLDWFQNGAYSVNGRCFDIGNTTRHALMEFERTGRLVAEADDASSGNGSIMRLAPVVIAYHREFSVMDMAGRSSETTHASKMCKSACEYLAGILNGLFYGQDLETALTWEGVEWSPHIRKVAEGSYKTGNVEGSGWVVKSLEAAIWACWSSTSFEEAVLKAVNLGDDADTTGAVAGQIAGAQYGYKAIPQHLIDGLARKDMIDKYLDPLLKLNASS